MRIRDTNRVSSVASDREYLEQKYRKYQIQYRNLQPSTVKEYLRYLDRFFLWLEEKGTVQKISGLTPVTLKLFLRSYSESHSPGSCFNMTTSLRSFFGFLWEHSYSNLNLLPFLPSRRGFKNRYVPFTLLEKDINRLLTGFRHNSFGGRRDYAIIVLLLCYGIRGAQIRRLRLCDINWYEDKITFPACKNELGVELPLVAEAGNALVEYVLKERDESSCGNVFLSLKKPVPLKTSSAVSVIINKRLMECGVFIPEGIRSGSHIFRHTFASRLLHAGESLKNISELLGHKYHGSTMVYTKIDLPHLREVASEWREV